MKGCIICNKEIVNTIKKGRPRLTCVKCEEVRKAKVIIKRCIICNKEIVNTIGRGRPKIICSVKCEEVRAKEWHNEYQQKPEVKAKKKAYLKEYSQLPKVKAKRQTLEFKARQKELCQKAHLKKYGLTKETYNEILKQQNNKCAICKNEETNTFKGQIVNLSIDHNHKTGKVRGLLCLKCNTSLGNLKDDISLFYKCIEYLNHYQKDKEKSKYPNLKKDGLTIIYKLTTKEYNKMLKQQGGVCAICRNKETKKVNNKTTKLSLDHDWETGKIRGLLCKDCNVTLGNLKDDISLFYKCIEYLKQHS